MAGSHDPLGGLGGRVVRNVTSRLVGKLVAVAVAALLGMLGLKQCGQPLSREQAARRATVRVEGREIGVAETVFAVTSRDPELDEVAPDPRFLAWLGGATGGRLHLPGDPGPMLIDPDADRVVRERKETPLWRAPLLSLLVGLSAGLAWVIRRRAGLR
jgi:hypothetical protein